MTTLEKILQEIDSAINENMECIYDEDGVRRFCLDSEFARFIINEIIKKHLSCENHTETTRQSRDNGWIPCSERMPDIGDVVLITDKDGTVYGDIEYGKPYEQDDEICFHSWDDEGWQLFRPEVVAWMPYPEPYKPPVESAEEKSMREREEFFKDGE